MQPSRRRVPPPEPRLQAEVEPLQLFAVLTVERFGAFPAPGTWKGAGWSPEDRGRRGSPSPARVWGGSGVVWASGKEQERVIRSVELYCLLSA